MKKETLKKAKNLENDISEYSDLLRSRNASYGTMFIKISCAYANDCEDYHGRVDKEVWDKMLDVLAEERRKAMQELENLTDEPDEEIVTDTPEAERGGWQPVDQYKERDYIALPNKPQRRSLDKIFMRFLDNAIVFFLYAATFCLLLGIALPTLSTREYVGYSLILGFFAGLLNNLERVMRELFKKED